MSGSKAAWLIGLIAVVFLALAPPSGLAPQTLTDWHDQSIFLRAAQETASQGLPDPETQTLVGPAYIGLTLGLSAFGITLSDALILLSRLTFIACAALLCFVGFRYRAKADIAFQVVLALVGIATLWTSVWFRATDIPWTHFVAAALLGAILLISLSNLPPPLRAALIGALAITLMQTRLFEAMVAAIAGILILPVAIARHWQALRTRPLRALFVLIPALVGGALAFLTIGFLSHNWSLYQQYGDQQGMVLAPQLAPLKAVQIFWDTCFETLCSFAPSTTVSPLADSIESWHQPLLLQLPGLLAALVGLLILLAFRPRRILQLPLGILFSTLAAGGLILAYLCGAPSGSAHLKYGFFRDFIPPLILLTGAFIATLAWERAEDGRAGPSIVASLVVFFALVAGMTGLRAVGLPAIAGGQIAKLEIASICEADRCSFTLTATDFAGKSVSYNDLAYVTCDGNALPKSIQHIAELAVDPKTCGRIAVIPLAAGVLLTPEDEAFSTGGLDLTRPVDILTVPAS